MVASGTRKARAISAVVNPPRSRRVSATWAAVDSAGWQQVKISRKASSSTSSTLTVGQELLSAAGRPAPCRRSKAAWACLSSREASRRSRSIARLPCGRDDPAGRGGRDTGRRPALDRGGKSILDGVLGNIDARRTSAIRTATARPYSRTEHAGDVRLGRAVMSTRSPTAAPPSGG